MPARYDPAPTPVDPPRAAASVARVTTMRPGTVHDLPGVYRVCLLTGAAGERRERPARRPRPARPRLGRPLPRLPRRRHPRAARRPRGRRLLPRRARHGRLRAVGRARSGSRPCASATRVGSGTHPGRRAPWSSGCTTPPPRMPGCSPRTRPTSTSTSCRGCRARAGVGAWSSRCWRGSPRPGPPACTWASTRATPGRSSSTQRLGFTELRPPGPALRDGARPRRLTRQPRVTEPLRCPSAAPGTAAGRSASAPRSGSRTSRRASPRRAPSPRTARRWRGRRGRGTPGPRR